MNNRIKVKPPWRPRRRLGVRVCGWVRTRRGGQGLRLLELNDGSCLANLQAVVDKGSPAG
jgi:asparaginyl-tRNA synthetase